MLADKNSDMWEGGGQGEGGGVGQWEKDGGQIAEQRHEKE